MQAHLSQLRESLTINHTSHTLPTGNTAGRGGLAGETLLSASASVCASFCASVDFLNAENIRVQGCRRRSCSRCCGGGMQRPLAHHHSLQPALLLRARPSDSLVSWALCFLSGDPCLQMKSWALHPSVQQVFFFFWSPPPPPHPPILLRQLTGGEGGEAEEPPTHQRD